MEHTVIFQPSGRRGKFPAGATVLDAARKLGVGIEAICGDNLVCGKCKIKIMDGNFPKEGITSSINHVAQVADKDTKILKDLTARFEAAQEGEERRKIQRKMDKLRAKHENLTDKEREENIRLACGVKVSGDLIVFVPEASRTSEGIVSKKAGKINVKIKPAVSKVYVELPPPSLEDPTGDYERLVAGLERDHKIKGHPAIDYRALQQLPDALRAADWKVTVTLWHRDQIIRVEPGKVERNIGLAVDIGTTTVAGYLTDLATGEVLATESMMNPQVRFGEDVMSRITYCMLNGRKGLEELQRTIIDGLNTIAERAAEKVGLAPADISEAVLVGNTAMHHILLGINPEYVGAAPFAPGMHHSFDINAERLGLKILPAGNVHVLPIEAGFVGADNVGCLLADEPHRRDEITLLIDIGTNGELVLGNKEKLISCSTATGPALEGGEIQYGIRATAGAIENVKVEPETLDVLFKVIGDEEWSDGQRNMGAKGICGSAIIDAIAEMFKARVIKKNGQFNKELSHPRVRKNAKGMDEFVVAWKHETALEEDISITIKDVRAIQLAKGALYSGCQIMLRKLGVEKFDRLAIAGAFGSHINKYQAMVIGMYPDCDPETIEFIGNAAGDGARIALVNVDKRREADEIARRVEYVELALEEDFNDRFGEAMQLPHMFDRFPHIESILPVEEAAQEIEV